MTRADVIVAGGGLAGASCAIAAANRGLQVSLVRASRSVVPLGECVTSTAVELIEAAVGCSITSFLRPLAGRVACWGSDTPSYRDRFFELGRGLSAVDRPGLEEIALNRARDCGVCVVEARVRGLEPVRGGWRLVAGEREHGASVLVDATGRAGVLGALARRKRTRVDRLVATIGFAPLDATDWLAVEARPDGWWYRAPATNQGIVVGRLSAPGGHGDLATWVDQLASTREVGRLPAGRGWTLAIRDASSHAMLDPPVGVVPVGDAAIARDPLCGQGIERAVTSGLAAARLLSLGLSPATCADIWRAQLVEEWQSYLRERERTYELETRWPAHPFWASRQRGALDDGVPAPR